MNNKNEIDQLIKAVKEKCPNLMSFQKTNFGEKPFETGVWELWLSDNADVYLHIEVQAGMIWAIYPSKEFDNKYPADATNICNFLKGI